MLGSLQALPSVQTKAVPERWQTSDRCSCDFALQGRVGEVYNEEAFRHFLAIERKRAEQSSRSFLLLLIRFRNHSEQRIGVPRALAGMLFAGLARCLREVDLIGWYREGHVAGAVLTQGAEAPAPDACRRITERVTSELGRHLPPQVAGRLRLRVFQLRQRVKC